MKLTVVVLTSLLAASTLFGAERRVPSPYLTIQQAISAAQPGDVVIIEPGTYKGTNNRDLNLLGKAITVRSTDPGNPSVVASTIIDCQGTSADKHRGFYFGSNETPTSIVDGLTIQNGYHDYSGGIYINNCSPTIRRCTVRRTTGEGAMYLTGVGCESTVQDSVLEDNVGAGLKGYNRSAPDIIRCLIQRNEAGYGAGLYFTDSAPLVLDCIIRQNRAANNGGGFYASPYSYTLKLLIVNCLFDDNSAQMGGAIVAEQVPLLICNCTFVNNVANSEGGAVRVASGSTTDRTIANSIFWNNIAPQGLQLALYNATVSVTNSTVQGGQVDVKMNSGSYLDWDLSNLYGDPGFVARAVGNYQLLANSPCIDAGTNYLVPYSVEFDLLGEPRYQDDAGMPDSGYGFPPLIDMGCYEFQGTSSFGDEDGDGVADPLDKCPGTIAGVSVDAEGCPPPVPGDLDRDGDVDQTDFGIFQRCQSGPNVPADPNCE